MSRFGICGLLPFADHDGTDLPPSIQHYYYYFFGAFTKDVAACAAAAWPGKGHARVVSRAATAASGGGSPT